MKLSRYLRETCRNFADYTSISGFGQILRSEHWVEALLWFLTIVLGTILVVYDCAAPITAYMSEASLSSINVVYGTLHFPGSTICIQVDTGALEIHNVSALADAGKVSSFVACLKSEECAKLDSFFDTFTDHINAAAKILSRHYVIENAYEMQFNASDDSVSESIPSEFYQLLLGDDWLPKHLETSLGYAFCSRMKLTVKYTKNRVVEVSDVCSTSAIVWFGLPPRSAEETDLLCYDIGNFTQFKSMSEYYELTFYPRNVLPAQAPASQFHFAYLGVDDEPTHTDSTSNYASVSFGKCQQVELKLTTRITLLSKRSRPCDSERSHLECLGRCIAQEIANKCNCSSASWRVYHAATEAQPNVSCLERYSPPKEYERCGRAAHAEHKYCSHPCLQLCEKNVFNLVQSDCKNEYPANATTFFYNMYREFYSLIEEQLTFNLGSLFASLGGTVGLWLGVGFIGLLEGVLFLPKALFEYFWHTARKKTRTQHADDVAKRLLNLETDVARLIKVVDSTKRSETRDASMDVPPATI